MPQGNLRKLKNRLLDPVEYTLLLNNPDTGEQQLALNALIGKTLHIHFEGHIHCIHCGRKTKKSFAQGYCYPCFSGLPECDSCIVSPEKCHYRQGTCRQAQWGKSHCLQDHYVYLSNTSEKVKVGITRGTQIPTRWIDQGAVQALPIFRVSERYYSGLLEVLFKQQVSDRTQWQRMLKGNIQDIDLLAERDRLWQILAPEIQSLQKHLQDAGEQNPLAIEYLPNEKVLALEYPVQEYPLKVKSLNLDKTPEITGVLQGIKGQYLIFDVGVINIRKYAGYQVSLEVK